MSRGRRVILFLVEGPSDETALVGPFSALYTARGEGAGLKAESEAFYCDVTTVRLFGSNTGLKVEDRTRNTVRGFILDRIESRHAYEWGDIDRVIHVVDLDGAFIPDGSVRRGDGPGFGYGEECIEAARVEDVIERNREKASALKELVSCSELTYKRRSVPYGVHFVSRNLEHALYGLSGDYPDEEKRRLSVAFAYKYQADPEGFARLLLSDVVRVPGNDLRETWKYAMDGTNSLKRGSNLHLLLNHPLLSCSTK